MKHKMWTPLLLASGILCSTWICVQTEGYGMLVLSGPVFMILVLFSAIFVEKCSSIPSSIYIRNGVVSGLALLLAGVILAIKDPVLMTQFMPISGSIVAFSIILSFRKKTREGCCCC